MKAMSLIEVSQRNKFNTGEITLKKIVSFILFVFVCINVQSQNFSFQWNESIINTTRINPSEVFLDNHKNVVVAGNFTDTLFFGNDTLTSPLVFNGFIAVFDSIGVNKWIKVISSPKFSGISNIIEKNGGYIISGTFQDTLYFNGTQGLDTIVHNGYAANFFISMDGEGEFEWIRSYGLNSFGNRTILKNIDTDNYLFTGSFNGNMVIDDTLQIDGRKGIFGINLNESGSFSLSYIFGNQGDIILSDALAGADSSLYLCGFFKGKTQLSAIHELNSEQSYNGFLMHLNSDMEIEGMHLFNSNMDNYPQKLLMDSIGRLIMVGEFSGCLASGNDTLCAEGKKDMFFAAFSSSFELMKLENMGGLALKQLGGIKFNKFGDLIVTGNFRGQLGLDSVHVIESGPEYFDVFMAKYDLDFNLKRLSHFTGSRSNQARNLLMDDEGYYYYYGSYSESFTFGQDVLEGKGSDVVLSKFFDCDYKKELVLTNTDTTFCGSGEIWAPDGFASYNWSNGFSNQNTYCDTEGWVSLTVTDMYGCISNDSLYVMINPLPEIALPDTVFFCTGDSVSLDAGDSGYSYFWNTGNDRAQIVVDTEGVYTVVVSSENQCSDSATVVLREYENPEIEINDFYQIENGQEISLYPGNFNRYFWSNGSIENTLVIIGDSTLVGLNNYGLNLISHDGCNLNKNFIVEKTETRLLSNNPSNSNNLDSQFPFEVEDNSDMIVSEINHEDTLQILSGIEMSEAYHEFEVWPNPCKEFFNYRFFSSEQFPGAYSIILINSQAKVIKKIQGFEHEDKFASGTVSVEGIPPGMYFIMFKQNNKVSIKIIVIL